MICTGGAMSSGIARVRRWLFVTVVAAGLGAVACGGGGKSDTHKQDTVPAKPVQALPQPKNGPSGFVPAPSPTGNAASAGEIQVIRGWADALRRGDVHAAGGYFALPSEMIPGPDANGDAIVLTLRTRDQADAAQLALPCGARFVSADQRGKYVNALFRLTGRSGPGGSDCGSGAGLTARTNFVIAHGRILEWIRAPDDPGDNHSPQPQQQSTPHNGVPVA
jgi:hypothetical protein